MRDRVIRAGLYMSEAWCRQRIEARELYLRLIATVDDFGCYDGRDNIIASVCYPNAHDRPDDIPILLQELHRALLIIKYSNAGRLFLAVPRWSHDFRRKREFPAPPINVDKRDVKYRGKFGQDIDWRNPEGYDDVSILLGVDGREVVPQPPEWRRLSDWWPMTSPVPKPVTATVTSAVTTRKRPEVVPAVTGAQSLRPIAAVTGSVSGVQRITSDLETSDSKTLMTPLPVDVVTGPVTEPVTATASPTTSTADEREEQVNFNGRAFDGVSEAQELRWQDMFASISVPDQIARAAAWLAVQAPEQRNASLAGGHGAFLVRWLLRESRNSTSDNRKAADA